MARINIEDDFWDDIGDVVAGVGDKFRAYGMTIAFFKFAQRKYSKGQEISESEFFEAGFHESLIGPFAKRTPSRLQADSKQIQANGSKKHFGWLDQKKAAGSAGGKKSARRARSKNGQLLPKESKQKPSTAKHSQASSSSSFSSSNSSCLAISEKSPPVNPVSFYCDLWKAKNGKSPDIRGKEAGQLKKFSEDLGIDRACQVMRAYFSMPDPLFIRRGYDVSTMLLSLAAIAQFEANGKIVTKKVVEHIETQVDKIQGTSRRPRKSIEEMDREKAEMMAEASQPKLTGSGT